MTDKKKTWKELSAGGVITKAGNSKEYKTGDWRVQRAIFDNEKCSQCMLCVIFCPDAAIKVEDGKVVGINYDYCKGCGICAAECPKDALEMKNEAEFKAKKRAEAKKAKGEVKVG